MPINPQLPQKQIQHETIAPTSLAPGETQGYKIKILFDVDPIDAKEYKLRPFKVLKVWLNLRLGIASKYP